MFMLLYFALLFCRGYESYRVHNEVTMKNEMMIENILRSYVKPIKQLSADFPNHELELQIQFQETTKRSPQRRFLIYKKPKINYRRDNMETDYPYDVGPGFTKNATTVPQTTVTSPQTPSTTETMKKRLVVITSTTEDPDQKPVYLKDLQRILDKFADKIKSTSRDTKTECARGHATTNEYPPQIIISNPGPIHSNRNINEVIELIRKGEFVKKHVTKPTDEDLDWLQIKIPTH